MPFPRKFRHLIEATPADVEKPDCVWLTWAVCAVQTDSCGWSGRMIEAAFRHSIERQAATLTGDRLLPAVDTQLCPRCGRTTFRTGVSLRLEPSLDQSSTLTEGVDYDAAPIEWDD